MGKALTVQDDSNQQLDNLQDIRYGVINSLMSNPELIKTDKDLRRDLRGFLKDAGTQIQTKQRIESDDENSKADLALKESYMAVLQRNGGRLPQAIDGEKVVNPELPSIDDFDFKIDESEIKIGNDIDTD